MLLFIQSLFAQKLTHGPFAGGVTPASARFYVRVDTTARVNVELSTSQNFSASLFGSERVAEAANDFAVLIDATNLVADILYFYRAVVNGAPVGEVRQFRTFPPPGARVPFLFTFGSCQQNRPWQNSPGAGRVFTQMANDRPCFFLQIGDWGYPDTTDTMKDSTRFFSLDMSRIQESYRAKYDSTYALQRLLRVAPVDYVYDDHDYMNNNASAFTANDAARAREIPAPPQARLNSIRGYQQLFPGYPLANPNGGIWHKFTYGNADFFMLDTRSQRSPNMNALRRNPATGKFEFIPDNQRHSILAGDSTLFGENQRQWLQRELRASTADWKFVVTSVPFNRSLRRALDLALAAQDSVVFVPGFGQVTGLFIAVELLDKWIGFEKEQQELLRFIFENRIKNVIILSGDTHTAAIDDGANAGVPEIMAGGLDITNSRIVALLELLGVRIWNRGGQTLMSSNFNNAYGRLTVFAADSVRMEIVDEFGSVLARHVVLDGSLPVNVTSPKSEVTKDFTLSSTYPNPLRAAGSKTITQSRYSLPAEAVVTAAVYDFLGRRVRSLQNGKQPAGAHVLLWDGKNDFGATMPNGIYLLSMKIVFQNGRQQTATQKIALIK
ncbi:MAG: alkaline phosphatase D family protein [candidate division KSB1 bacterium]|nr:alkaline phosphatase D family protein [candidate division KSB1 bacterium]MDZ7367037.1 alkaline phosphatase D family protein [candidate division KSB1 bacterium]MDZ7406737.1 alkaline phosphatase D family protein [candidate division KSB1 bacterium]